jgi:hypothetical protein
MTAKTDTAKQRDHANHIAARHHHDKGVGMTEGQTSSEVAEKLLADAWARAEIDVVGADDEGRTLYRFTA